MELEEQVHSPDNAKELKELGVEQEGRFRWGNLIGIIPHENR
jgi:hypothetical protein